MPRKRTRRTSPTPSSSPPPSKNHDEPNANTNINPSASTSHTPEITPQTLSPTDEEMPEEDIQHTGPQPPSSSTFTGGYNALKSHKGQIYSGMAVGGSHTWTYDEGTWTETKEEPDLWRIDYRTDKRRKKRAPKGSGAPVGTEYHWLIVGHQMVKKTDANTYETHLTGSKYKLAYKSANSNSWSIPTVKKQRDREVELLEDAKQRVRGRPPVLASERVRVAPEREKGQQKLDMLFAGASAKGRDNGGRKRREDEVDGSVGDED